MSEFTVMKTVNIYILCTLQEATAGRMREGHFLGRNGEEL